MISCQNPAGDPALACASASAPSPMHLHIAQSVPIQVIRTDEYIEIMNSTAVDYNSSTLWLNQRYSGKLPSLLAGTTLRVNLWSFRDSYGEQFNAGGIWRTDEPTQLVIAEVQTGENEPLIGLIVIGGE